LSFCAKRNLWRENYLCCLHKMRTVPKPSSDFWQPVQRLDQTSDRPSMPVKRAGESCKAFKWRKTGYKIAMQTVSYQCSSLCAWRCAINVRPNTQPVVEVHYYHAGLLFKRWPWRCIATTCHPACLLFAEGVQCKPRSVIGAVQSTCVRARSLSWRCITTTPGCCSRGGRGGVLLPHATKRACCLRRSVQKCLPRTIVYTVLGQRSTVVQITASRVGPARLQWKCITTTRAYLLA
jgi:hypothetical protein